MVERRSGRVTNRSDRTRDARSVKKFLEELAWVLSSYSHLDFRAVAENIDSVFGLKASDHRLARYVSKNPNIHFLIGTLPVIFSNEKFFPTNEDITEFASEALRLPISRWEKRSRYELIGLIVCETAKLDDDRLARLVDALSKIVSDDPNAQGLIRDRKANRLSWNEVIQKLSHAEVE
jgi:hypothetical protein